MEKLRKRMLEHLSFFLVVQLAALEESVRVATGLCLVICVGPKLLPLLDCVHSGGLICHLHKKLTA